MRWHRNRPPVGDAARERKRADQIPGRVRVITAGRAETGKSKPRGSPARHSLSVPGARWGRRRRRQQRACQPPDACRGSTRPGEPARRRSPARAGDRVAPAHISRHVNIRTSLRPARPHGRTPASLAARRLGTAGSLSGVRAHASGGRRHRSHGEKNEPGPAGTVSLLPLGFPPNDF